MQLNLSLKQADQQRLNTLITNFSKSQPNMLKFSQIVMLLLDRAIFCFRFTFKQFYQIFMRAYAVKNKKDLGKDSLHGEKILGRQQILFMFNQIGKLIFRIGGNSQQRFYQQFLSEKVVVNQGQFHTARIPSFQENNRRLLCQECFQIFSLYQDELKHVYNAYFIENYFSQKKAKRLLLNQREISLQNKIWPFTSLILFMKQSETTPHLITIDHLQQTLRQITPHTNQKQQQFFSRHIIVDSYQKEAEQHQATHHAGDPGLYFHQFLLLIGRIAWDCFPKQLEKKSLNDVISRYFSYLFLRKNQDIQKTQLPALNRKMITKMKEYFKYLQSETKEFEESKKTNKEESPIDIITKRIKNQIMNSADLGIDFAETAKNLDKQLPKLPPLPVIVPQCPPPYSKDSALTIGQQPPPQPVDKEKGGGKPEKKSGNKQQGPVRDFQWADMPTTKTVAQDHLKSIENKITYEVKPLSDIERGTIKKESYPVIIGETLFPGELPKSVVPHLKQAAHALNERNFILALQCYQNGLKAWKKTQVQADPAAQLFFQYSKGNIYLSIGRLEYALQSFYNCRKYSDTNKLSFNNPDRSLPYFGLGQVFFEMQQYTLAARSFLKARQIRENILGLQHVQTATVFNNLACCYFMLSRSHEALGYIQIAQVVLDTELGEHHERTMLARSNLKKITGGTFENQPQYKRFWEVFEEDKFEKKKKKKEKQGKKK